MELTEKKKSTTARFYVDERDGVVAVRDSKKDDECFSGLHPDMDGVIAYWSGFKDYDETGMVRWNLHEWQREKAKNLCAKLNS